MAVAGASFGMVAIVAVIFALILQVAQAQSPSPAPAPTSDGTSIDQGIACALMVLALVETLKWGFSLLALARIWRHEGASEDNRLSTTLDEVILYPIPALLYLVKNLLQYYILEHVDAPGYQILKNLNVISTGVLYRIILKKKLSNMQWVALILLCAGCITSQTKPSFEVFYTSVPGLVMAIVMALLSGFAGVYTEAIMKKRPSRNINVDNFWLYLFGIALNIVAVVTQDFDAVMNKGFFYGYSFITLLMILNQALSLVETITNGEIHRSNFQEQLEEIDSELVRFETKDGKVEESGLGSSINNAD
ncbi:hypothetical protein SO802_024393 [Lithocarpus litseifolius]|uniref:Uncharacterized protein n=1 Tax=Lithocarpus litseifolius TaxID=425828 RepID=A0AAW2CCF8_9ROSI